MTALEFICSRIVELETDSSLFVVENFTIRAEAIDLIDFHLIGRLAGMKETVPAHPSVAEVSVRAATLRARLQITDEILFSRIREEIRTGGLRRTAFAALIDSLCPPGPADEQETGYDNRDLLLNGVLSFAEIPEPTAPVQPDMIFYQKTPVRIVLQMAEEIIPCAEERFMDLGSGLGQVTLLIHLLTGMPATGVEYEPAYCGYAAERAQELNLPKLAFVNQDARNADLSPASVFFLYTPFQGRMLATVLKRLNEVSRKKAIRVFSYGPVSKYIARERWLKQVAGDADDAFSLCRFESPK